MRINNITRACPILHIEAFITISCFLFVCFYVLFFFVVFCCCCFFFVVVVVFIIIIIIIIIKHNS